MPADDTKDEHIHIVVTEGQKARWKQLVDDEPQYDSLSAFVREAAEKQWARDRGESDVPDAIDDMRNSILEQLESIESNLMLFNENLENVRSRQVDEDTIDEIVGGHVNALESQLESLEHAEDGTGGEGTDE
jgi:Arc/MetJ-type ribon-helix-helix transcriptional regulator